MGSLCHCHLLQGGWAVYINVIHCRGDGEFISFEAATAILRDELHYPEERALHFVKRFDHNNDGRLSAAEFSLFRTKIAETSVRLYSYVSYNNSIRIISKKNQIKMSTVFPTFDTFWEKLVNFVKTKTYCREIYCPSAFFI